MRPIDTWNMSLKITWLPHLMIRRHCTRFNVAALTSPTHIQYYLVSVSRANITLYDSGREGIKILPLKVYRKPCCGRCKSNKGVTHFPQHASLRCCPLYLLYTDFPGENVLQEIMNGCTHRTRQQAWFGSETMA